MKRVLKCMISVFNSKKEEKSTLFTECLCKLDKLEKELLNPPKVEEDVN